MRTIAVVSPTFSTLTLRSHAFYNSLGFSLSINFYNDTHWKLITFNFVANDAPFRGHVGEGDHGIIRDTSAKQSYHCLGPDKNFGDSIFVVNRLFVGYLYAQSFDMNIHHVIL